MFNIPLRLDLKTFPIWLYAILLGILYGGIATAQVLGSLKLYKPILAIPVSLMVGGLITWGYLRRGEQPFFDAILPTRSGRFKLLEIAGYLCGLALLVLLIFPLAAWPYTPISETLNWDAGNYHFPIAIEQYRTGSAWDLSLSYGEYPSGYESLLAFSLAIKGDAFLFGVVHALIGLFLSLTAWFLACRYTRLPPGLLFFGVNALLLSGALPFESNLWWILKHLVFTIGKNDLFLGAALLAVILHMPAGAQLNQETIHSFGLAAFSMIAVSVKPNALPLVALVWTWVLFRWLTNPNRRLTHVSWKRVVFLILVILPGLLWLVRNLIALGMPFSEETSELFRWSIAANLFNPFFYHFIPQHLILLTGLVILALALSLSLRYSTWRIGVLLLVLFVSFVLTPASAFLNNTETPTQIVWRFAAATLVYTFLVMLHLLDPLLHRLYSWVAQKRLLTWLSILFMVSFSAWLIQDQRSILILNTQNAIVLHDQFREPVGVNGYYSAYDYVQQNVRDSIIHIDNGLPFYLYDAGFTNSTTHQQPSDYFVIFRTAWFSGWPEGYPDRLDSDAFQQTWTLIYEDDQGRVYRRR